MPEPPMPLIIRKVPFEQKVFTQKMQVWGYTIQNKKPVYFYLCSYWFDPDWKPEKTRLSKAVEKSINRNSKKLIKKSCQKT